MADLETPTIDMAPSHTPRDHILAIVKAALNAVPVVGGSLASLIGDYVPTSNQMNAERAMTYLRERLSTLETRISVEASNKEDFAELFKTYLLVIVRTSRKEKLRAASNIVANALLRPDDPSKSTFDELDHMLRCVDQLSAASISVLIVAKTIAQLSPASSQGHFQFSQLLNHFPALEPSFLMSLVSELRSVHLVRVQEPGIRREDYGNYYLEVTKIGRLFIDRFVDGQM